MVLDHVGSHYPTKSEVYECAWILHHFMPWELVACVLDTAEYWPIHRRHINFGWHAPKLIHELNSPFSVFGKIPIFSSELASPVRRPIQKVVFLIEAHCQRLRTSPEGGPWTWYDAKITPPGGDGESFVVERIATNLQPKYNWNMHEVEWNRRDHRDLLDMLEHGSSLEVLAQATYPPWKNYVARVQVEFRTTALR